MTMSLPSGPLCTRCATIGQARPFSQVAWQLLHQWAGDTALTAPLPTLEHLWTMIGQKRFVPHVTETGWGMPLEVWVQAAQLGLRVKEVGVPRLYLDPNLVPRLQGRRTLVVDDVISSA